MKSKKQRKKRILDAANLASKISYRPGHKVAVCRTALSEESQLSWSVSDYYSDEYYKCVDCRKECLFSAEQQKEWYEVEKRYINQRPIRCQGCFINWRSSRKAKSIMDAALDELNLVPDSTEAMRKYALSIVDFHKSTGKGNIDTAIHIFRQLKDDGDAMLYCTAQVQKAIGDKT